MNDEQLQLVIDAFIELGRISQDLSERVDELEKKVYGFKSQVE